MGDAKARIRTGNRRPRNVGEALALTFRGSFALGRPVESLCHQGDVYDASFAAVPRIRRCARSRSVRASREFDYFALPVAIELGRAAVGIEVPTPLRTAYFEAMKSLAELSHHDASAQWNQYAQRAAALLNCSLTATIEGRICCWTIPMPSVNDAFGHGSLTS